MSGPCLFEGCGAPARRLGLCAGHYTQQRRGLALTPLRQRKPSITVRPQLQWLIDHAGYEGDECLIWPFSRYRDGRGQVAVGEKTKQAHRVMCELKNGEPPTRSHEAAHECGRGHLGCVHPGHLTWKTSKQNKADTLRHGTRIMGEKHPAAILTEQQVIAIRRLARVASKRDIAEVFGLYVSHVTKIVNRASWRHI